jgi:hypothetical protein
MKKETILVVSGQVVYQNSKINWPDSNYPKSGQTVLRYLHSVDIENKKIQLDGHDGPWFSNSELPENVGFFKRI